MKIVNQGIMAAAMALLATTAMAQPAAQGNAQSDEPRPFQAGAPLGINANGEFSPISDNVRVFGSFAAAESCVFDPERNLILAINGGVPQALAENDAYVSLINPDGTVHTSKWIGATRDGLTLNQTLGAAIGGDVLYINDMNTVRSFDLATGEPLGAVEVPESSVLNGIAATADGTVYPVNTSDPQRVYEISPEGEVSILFEGEPLAVPNGAAIDPDGNIVIVNIRSADVLTISPEGELLNTEESAQSGNDGIVILEDGTKYISSVIAGGITRLAPGGEPELIATGIPNAASICYDSVQNQIVVPMTAHNALGFVSLD